MSNAINWFEIPVVDFERAKKFYSDIFGIEMPENVMQGYRMGFFPYEQGKISGAIVHGEGYKPSTDGAVVYLNGGEDLNNVLNKIEEAGGKIVMPKTNITPEIGNFAFFIDSEGNKVALHSMN